MNVFKEDFYGSTLKTIMVGYIRPMSTFQSLGKEGRKEIIYLMTHSTHFNVVIWKEMFYLTTHSTHFNAVIWKEMFYLTTHSTHFIYGYMASDIW